MSNKIKDLDTDTLLEVIKNAPRKKKDPLLELELGAAMRLSVSYWLREREITRGKYKVPFKFIYADYKKWCKDRDLPYIATHYVFSSIMTDLFKKNKRPNYVFYYISKDLEHEKEEAEEEKA